ncbi:hypothetical protein P9A16_32470 [Shinella sp. 838]|uniref:hypothetical protein n=1 Tax=Shinella sp. 838 TaxID=3038164 RepID=UPI0024155845|nr:hypothetical protein [Shinella sp. 838]MDG4675818.1 hypothetical protein [Shinella sp. 838]
MRRDELTTALQDLLKHVDRNTCEHEDTHRAGTLWTVCDCCGMKWADDEGGFQPHTDAPAVAQARAALSAALSIEQTQPVAMQVKGLEWSPAEGKPGRDVRAQPDPYHHYTVRHLSDGHFDLILTTDLGVKYFQGNGVECHSSYSAAKAAAQHDYETRIRSAIVGVAAEPEPVAWMYQFKTKAPVLMVEKRNWAETHSEWTETPLYAHPPVSALVNAQADADVVEKVSTEAAMSQWERSLKRPDLSEKDRVRGAIEAYKRQAFAFTLSSLRPAEVGSATETSGMNKQGSNGETLEKVCTNDPENVPKNENIGGEP